MMMMMMMMERDSVLQTLSIIMHVSYKDDVSSSSEFDNV